MLPGLLVIGAGMGCIFAPAFGTATLGVQRHEAGVASAMVNTSQQVGGSIGTALLSTIFATAADELRDLTRARSRAAPGRRGARLHRRRSGGRRASSPSACSIALLVLPKHQAAPAPEGAPGVVPATAD